MTRTFSLCLSFLAIFLLFPAECQAFSSQAPYVNHFGKYVTIDDVFFNDGDDMIEIRWDGIGWEMFGPTSYRRVDSIYNAYLQMGYTEPPIRYVYESYIVGGFLILIVGGILMKRFG